MARLAAYNATDGKHTGGAVEETGLCSARCEDSAHHATGQGSAGRGTVGVPH